MWRAKLDQIVILLVALTVLTGVFFFQDWFASRPRLYERVRLGFLVFTLVWLGWYAQAQLSSSMCSPFSMPCGRISAGSIS